MYYGIIKGASPFCFRIRAYVLEQELSDSESERLILIEMVKDAIIEVTIVKMVESANAILEKYYNKMRYHFFHSIRTLCSLLKGEVFIIKSYLSSISSKSRFYQSSW